MITMVMIENRTCHPYNPTREGLRTRLPMGELAALVDPIWVSSQGSYRHILHPVIQECKISFEQEINSDRIKAGSPFNS
jgi:hypothetical protein